MINKAPSEDLRKELLLSRRKKFLFSVAAALLAFAFVEVGVRIAGVLLRPPGPQREEDLSIYPDKEMATTLLQEYDEASSRVALPFSHWGPREFHGKYVNTDKNGMRWTWNPTYPTTSSIKTVEIFVFGGSTVFGAGARDEYTIPSDLSKLLNSRQPSEANYHVRNYGENGYSLMQSAVRLFTLLEAGERPDYVIFYGGANEVCFVNRTGVPGVAGAERFIQTLTEQRGILASGWNQIRPQLLAMMNDRCQSCKVAIAAVRYFAPSLPYPESCQADAQDRDDQRTADLSVQTAEDYQKNFTRFLNELAGGFHFKVAIFWQPTLLAESHRIGEENLLGRLDPLVNDKKAAELFKQTYRLIHTDAEHNFYDISDALEARTKECYADWVHLSEDCSLVVSKKIVEILGARYLSGNGPGGV